MQLTEEVSWYRPICLLTILSKLSEKLFLKKLKLEYNPKIPLNINRKYQFGFRENHTTMKFFGCNFRCLTSIWWSMASKVAIYFTTNSSRIRIILESLMNFLPSIFQKYRIQIRIGRKCSNACDITRTWREGGDGQSYYQVLSYLTNRYVMVKFEGNN